MSSCSGPNGDPTQRMYEAADAYYARINEIDGYGGISEGLAAVARDLGIDAGPDHRYISNRWHDPLSSSQITEPFSRKELSFRDVVAYLDKGFYGNFGYGKEHKLPHPYDRIDETYGRDWGYDQLSSHDLDWAEGEVETYLKRKKIRRNSKDYRAFVADNAQKVIDKASDLARNRAESTAQLLHRKVVDLEGLERKSRDILSGMEFDAKLRRAFLSESGVAADPVTDRSIAEAFELWEGSHKIILDCRDSLNDREKEILSHDNIIEVALHAIEGSKILKPFLEAVGLSSRFAAKRLAT